MGPVSGLAKNSHFVPRVKPLYMCSEKEITSIDSLFNNSNFTSNIFLRNNANIPNLLKHNNSRIIHIATHGIFNPQNPELSGLIMAASDSLSKNILFAGDLYL